jgi:hypothetical protein
VGNPGRRIKNMSEHPNRMSEPTKEEAELWSKDGSNQAATYREHMMAKANKNLDLSALQPSEAARERNEERRAPSDWSPDETDSCVLCARAVRITSATIWVECVEGALHAYPADAPRLDPDLPALIQHGIDMAGYMGCFPVGPSCAKKIPARYRRQGGA